MGGEVCLHRWGFASEHKVHELGGAMSASVEGHARNVAIIHLLGRNRDERSEVVDAVIC